MAKEKKNRPRNIRKVHNFRRTEKQEEYELALVV